ncbi:hypothetical protein HHI36_010779 [Cryptolaemus montrouzieri]|uniref:Uncharacterized protein n=1 Tax=Cryptolaemus montrouzieri TaxID=559131 RepID=A0ABD2MJW6_9CUCU
MFVKNLLLLVILIGMQKPLSAFKLEPLYIDSKDCCETSEENNKMILVPVMEYKGSLKPEDMKKYIKQMFGCGKKNEYKI